MEADEGLTGEELRAVREIRRELEDMLTKYGKRIAKEFAGKPVGFVYGFACPKSRKGMPGARLMRAGEDYITGGIVFSMLTDMPDISHMAMAAYNSMMERTETNIAMFADPTIS